MPPYPPNSVSIAEIARVLGMLASPPNRRETPKDGDAEGEYDFWFDGGACRMITGWTEYHFTDGTRAGMPVIPHLRVEILFSDGRKVSLEQESSG